MINGHLYGHCGHGGHVERGKKDIAHPPTTRPAHISFARSTVTPRPYSAFSKRSTQPGCEAVTQRAAGQCWFLFYEVRADLVQRIQTVAFGHQHAGIAPEIRLGAVHLQQFVHDNAVSRGAVDVVKILLKFCAAICAKTCSVSKHIAHQGGWRPENVEAISLRQNFSSRVSSAGGMWGHRHFLFREQHQMIFVWQLA